MTQDQEREQAIRRTASRMEAIEDLGGVEAEVLMGRAATDLRYLLSVIQQAREDLRDEQLAFADLDRQGAEQYERQRAQIMKLEERVNQAEKDLESQGAELSRQISARENRIDALEEQNKALILELEQVRQELTGALWRNGERQMEWREEHERREAAEAHADELETAYRRLAERFIALEAQDRVFREALEAIVKRHEAKPDDGQRHEAYEIARAALAASAQGPRRCWMAADLDAMLELAQRHPELRVPCPACVGRDTSDPKADWMGRIFLAYGCGACAGRGWVPVSGPRVLGALVAALPEVGPSGYSSCDFTDWRNYAGHKNERHPSGYRYSCILHNGWESRLRTPHGWGDTPEAALARALLAAGSPDATASTREG